MKELYYKVVRDPVYSEVFLSPLEIIISDTPNMQRLRYLSQLVGAEYVYPSATHTRFGHSVGVMHLSGLYAQHLYPYDYSKFRVLRLAGLMHDIGHGPYSHQFDDTVYKTMGYKDGHDEFRTRIIRGKLLEDTLSVYKNSSDPRIKNDFIHDIELTLGIQTSEENIRANLQEIFEKIIEVYEGENTGSVDFNIVQGPLGADRLDFVLRDSYFAGTRHFGSGATDRLIRGSSIASDKICYSIKVIDDVYTSLFARFMMYKNVYFHKTSRAADQMIQEVLRASYEVLNLKQRVEDPQQFVELTDARIMDEIEILYQMLFEKKNYGMLMDPELIRHAEKLSYAHSVIQRLKKRDLWKVIMEIPFSTTGVDPSLINNSVGQNMLDAMKQKLKELLVQDIPVQDKTEITQILEEFETLFKIDTPYKLSLIHPREFLANDVYIKDTNGDILGFDQMYEKYPAYRFMESNLIQIVRVYIKEDRREILKKYSVLPQSASQKITTRW